MPFFRSGTCRSDHAVNTLYERTRVRRVQQEAAMTPEDIIEHIDAQNRALLAAHPDMHQLSLDKVLDLMNTAAMRGFRFGSETALAAVKSKLVMKYISEGSEE